MKEPGTPPPTSRPSVTPLVTSIHPIQLILKNVNDNYALSAEVRSTLLRLVSELLTEYLAAIEGLDLVKVEYAGRLRQKNERRLQLLVESSGSRGTGLRHNNRHRQLLKSISVPLQITVLGTTDISDFALSYLMEIIRTNVLSLLVTYLRQNTNLTGSTVVMTADTFDFTDILTGSTNPPTGKPTPMPMNQKDDVQAQSMEEDNDGGGGMLWWIWLLIVLAILSLLLCVCIYCSKRRKSKSEEKQQQQAMYTWMKTGSTGSSYSTRTNPQSVSNRSQQERRRYDYDNEDDLFLGQAMNVRRKNRYNESRYYDEEVRRPEQKRSRQRQASRKQRSSKPKKKHRDDYRERSKKKRRKPRARDEQLQLEYGDYDDHCPNQGALVLYDTNDTNRGGALVPYDANRSYGTKEPEGNKVAKMKSMYAAEAYAIESLANNTRQTEDPEGKNADEVYSVIQHNNDTKNMKTIKYDDMQDEDECKRKKLKKSKTENDSLQYDKNGPVIYCNETDEPSMMTNHNDC